MSIRTFFCMTCDLSSRFQVKSPRVKGQSTEDIELWVRRSIPAVASGDSPVAQIRSIFEESFASQTLVNESNEASYAM